MKRKLQKGRSRKIVPKSEQRDDGFQEFFRAIRLAEKFRSVGLTKAEYEELKMCAQENENTDNNILYTDNSEASKRRDEQNLIAIERLAANEDDSKQFKALLHNWKHLQNQRNDESVEKSYIIDAEQTMLEELRNIESKYHFTKRYLDGLLVPPPPLYRYEQNHPRFLLSPYERIGIKNEEQLKILLQKYTETLKNDPTPVKELYHIWDIDFVEQDVNGDIQITNGKSRILSLNEYRNNGQKYLTLVLRIDAEQNLSDVVFPEIKEIITLRRKQIKGLKERRWSKNRHKQISAYKAFKQGKSPRIIIDILELTSLTNSLNKDNIETLILRTIYSVNEGKLILTGEKLAIEERKQLRLKLRIYLNRKVGRNTNS